MCVDLVCYVPYKSAIADCIDCVDLHYPQLGLVQSGALRKAGRSPTVWLSLTILGVQHGACRQLVGSEESLH